MSLARLPAAGVACTAPHHAGLGWAGLGRAGRSPSAAHSPQIWLLRMNSVSYHRPALPLSLGGEKRYDLCFNTVNVEAFGSCMVSKMCAEGG